MNSTWQAISHSLGNWEKGEERSRFPSGLKVLAEQVRSRGMEFGLWFEPERAGPNSLLAREHPDWVRRGPRDGWLLVDFGKPEVQDYFCTILDRFIRDLKIRYIRWDHNLHDGPLPFCRLMDPADRRGISQIRFVEGLHRVEDWVRQHHPGVILESCAGGGRRIDLDTLRRRHTIWISDQTMKTEIIRFHLEGLNHFLPGTGLLVGFTPPASLYQRNEKLPDIHYQSHFGGAFGAAGRIHQWSIPIREQMQNHVKVFKKTRRFLNEDYYLLGPQNRSLESWSAWQFHDPKADEGFVQAFRLGATEGSRRFVLRGLRPDVGYRFTDPYTGKTLERKGGTLLSQGLEFNLSQTSSQVWLYRKLRPAGAGTATPPAYFRVKSRS
jgi:alpha-galactosidase